MMNSLLANMRLLCVPSASQGQDWYEKSLLIDSHLQEEGMDLAEEAVYLLYSENPSEVLDGNGQCLVARSVIGPKKTMQAPLSQLDWKAAPVERLNVQGETFEEIMRSCEQRHAEAFKMSKGLAESFIICIQRKLVPELKLMAQAIFHE